MKILVLRTCLDSDGHSRGGFRYPKTRVAVVEAADWVDDDNCGHGLHGLPWGVGDHSLLDWNGNNGWVIEVADTPGNYRHGTGQLTDKCKFRRGIVRLAAASREKCIQYITKHAPPGTPISWSKQIGGDGVKQIAGGGSLQIAENGGTQNAGNDSAQAAENCTVQTIGDSGKQIAKRRVRQNAGIYSSQIAGSDSEQMAGHNSDQIASARAGQTAGNYSRQMGEHRANQKAGDYAVQVGLHYCKQTAGDRSHQIAGNYSFQKAGNFSVQHAGFQCEQDAGVYSVQVCCNESRQRAGNGTTQVGIDSRTGTAYSRLVGKKEAGKWYRFNGGNWSEINE